MKKTREYFSREEWLRIRDQVLQFKTWLLYEAIQYRLTELQELAVREGLDKSETVEIYRAQGRVKAYNRAIMVIEDLLEMSRKHV